MGSGAALLLTVLGVKPYNSKLCEDFLAVVVQPKP